MNETKEMHITQQIKKQQHKSNQQQQQQQQQHKHEPTTTHTHTQTNKQTKTENTVHPLPKKTTTTQQSTAAISMGSPTWNTRVQVTHKLRIFSPQEPPRHMPLSRCMGGPSEATPSLPVIWRDRKCQVSRKSGLGTKMMYVLQEMWWNGSIWFKNKFFWWKNDQRCMLDVFLMSKRV